jgi:hypothetical protein
MNLWASTALAEHYPCVSREWTRINANWNVLFAVVSLLLEAPLSQCFQTGGCPVYRRTGKTPHRSQALAAVS